VAADPANQACLLLLPPCAFALAERVLASNASCDESATTRGAVDGVLAENAEEKQIVDNSF
jgi:hypothetical protein